MATPPGWSNNSVFPATHVDGVMENGGLGLHAQWHNAMETVLNGMRAVRVLTSADTLTDNDNTLLFNCSTQQTQPMPTTGITIGRRYYMSNIGTAAVVLSGTISNLSNRVLAVNTGCVATYDGTMWRIVGAFDPSAPKLYYQATVDKTIGNTTTETSMFPTTFIGGGLTVPANRWTPGTKLVIAGDSVYTTTGVTAPTATVRIKLNGTTIESQSVNALLAGAVNRAATFRCELICRTTGTSGSLVSAGGFQFATDNMGGSAWFDLMNSGSDITYNTTVNQTVDVSLQWSATNGSLLIKNVQMTLWN